jgi:hypothetical protein
MIAQQERSRAAGLAHASAHSKVIQIQHKPERFFSTGHSWEWGWHTQGPAWQLQVPQPKLLWVTCPVLQSQACPSIAMESAGQVWIPLMFLNSLGSDRPVWGRTLECACVWLAGMWGLQLLSTGDRGILKVTCTAAAKEHWWGWFTVVPQKGWCTNVWKSYDIWW